MILDLIMPEMRGLNLVNVLRNYHRLKSLPIIIWTDVPEAIRREQEHAFNVTTLIKKQSVTCRRSCRNPAANDRLTNSLRAQSMARLRSLGP